MSTSKLSKVTTCLRFLALGSLVCIALVCTSVPVHAQSQVEALRTRPTLPRTQSTLFSLLRSLRTGEKTDAGPAIADCNGRLYVAWTGTPNQELNIGWGSTGGSFPPGDKVTIATVDVAFVLSPSLACYYGASGLQLYVAYTGSNNGSSDNHIHVGWFDGNSSHPYLHDDIKTGQTATFEPAISVGSDGLLYLAWTGTDRQQSLNITSSTEGTDWNRQVYTFSDSSDGEPGLVTYCGPFGCALYIAWIGTNAANNLNVAYFNWSSTLQHKQTISYTSWVGKAASLATASGELYLMYSGTYGEVNVATGLYIQAGQALAWGNHTFSNLSDGVAGTLHAGAVWLAWVQSQEDLCIAVLANNLPC